MVWIVFRIFCPGRAYRRSRSIARRKKSRPIIVGSPPCQATTTSGTRACASSSCRIYVSCRSAAIRNRDPGYSISLDKKKQYSQSRLHTAPVGLAITWKASGAPGTVITCGRSVGLVGLARGAA